MQTKTIYLDYNATTPIAPEVAEAMAPFLYGNFGNPSSSHPFGVTARQAVERARAQVATLLCCQPSEVIFTSGGTESNNYAIKGVALAGRKRGNHIITSAVEHPAVTEVCRWLAGQGFLISTLPVNRDGLLDPADLERAITADTSLVTVMQANNGKVTTGAVPGIITNSDLNVTDVDNLNSEITYTLTALPVNGQLLLNGVAMAVNDSFTQADLDNNNLVYQAAGTAQADQFGFTVTDGSGGVLANNTFDIVVQLAQVDDSNTNPVDVVPPDDPHEEPVNVITEETGGATEGAGGNGVDEE